MNKYDIEALIEGGPLASKDRAAERVLAFIEDAYDRAYHLGHAAGYLEAEMDMEVGKDA